MLFFRQMKMLSNKELKLFFNERIQYEIQRDISAVVVRKKTFSLTFGFRIADKIVYKSLNILCYIESIRSNNYIRNK